MTSELTDLFGEAVPPRKNRITILSIEAHFRREVLREDAPSWVSTHFTAASQVYEMFQELRFQAKEHFLALHLDGKNRICCLDRVSVGSLNQSIVHPREIFKTACLSSAAALILLHNHPSGDPTPSPEDIEVTRRIQEGGDLLGIRLLDHIIIGETYYSFAEHGII